MVRLLGELALPPAPSRFIIYEYNDELVERALTIEKGRNIRYFPTKNCVRRKVSGSNDMKIILF